MKIRIENVNNRYILPIIVLLVASLTNSYTIIGMLLILVGINSIYNIQKGHFVIDKHIFLYLIFIFWGILCGILFYISNSNGIYNFIKDIYYISNIMLFWISGKFIFSKDNNYDKLLSSVALSAALYSIVDLFKIILILIQNGISISSLQSYRTLIGTGNTLPIFGVYICFLISSQITLKKRTRNLINIVCIFDVLIHLSRTNIMILVILILSSGVIKKAHKAIKILIGSAVVIAITWIIFPNTFHLFVNKLLSSSTEMSVTNNSWDTYSIVNNWRGYEAHCEILQFKSVGYFEKIFGSGLGTQLDAQGYAYLVTDAKELAFLHNGYYTILMKWGLFGVIFYVVFLIRMIKQNNNRAIFKMELGMILALLFATAVINGPLFNLDLAKWFFILGGIYIVNRNIIKKH